jgi:hypothetical protein
MMSNVKTYTLTSAVSGETATSAGLVEFDFKAGDVTPADAAEERILEDLCYAHLATVKAPAAASPKSVKSAKVEE